MGFVNLLVNSFVFESVELLLRLNLIYVTDFQDIRIFFFSIFSLWGFYWFCCYYYYCFFGRLFLLWSGLIYLVYVSKKKTVSMIATVNNLHGFSFYGFYILNDWIVWMIAVRDIISKICVAARWLITHEFMLDC